MVYGVQSCQRVLAAGRYTSSTAHAGDSGEMGSAWRW